MDQRFPWATYLRWEALFHTVYALRSVSLEIWRASKGTQVVFEEMKFGETPLGTARRILEHLPPLNENSLIYDLGCGRGRAAFMFHFLSGAKVIAVDVVPSFVGTGRRLARWCGCTEKVLFYYEDFRESQLEEADMIYACALCLGPETRGRLLEKITGSGWAGSHLVSVGWRPQHPRLEPIAHFSASFSWGPSTVSIARLRGDDASLAVNDDRTAAPADAAPS